MTDTDTTDSPLATAAGAAGTGTVEAFGLLGNATRLAILLALWEADDPHAPDDAVPFSDLRERVGMRDSGQFNYHLGKLGDHFVENTGDGYRLRPVGLELVRTVVAGTGREAALPPTEIDFPCDLCGAPTVITYRDGWLYHLCTECEGGFGRKEGYPAGVLFGEPFPPAALSNRTPEELFAAGVFRLLGVMSMKLGGLCPQCSGVIDTSMDVCESHDPGDGAACPDCGNVAGIRVRFVCTVCKYRGSISPAGAAGLHPAAIAFYHEHGVDVGYPLNDFESSRRVLELLRDHEQELVSTDPLRVRVTVRHGDDELELTLDENLAVVETHRPG